MKKSITKLMALTLVGVMALTGCGKKEPGSTSQTTQGGSTASTESTTQTQVTTQASQSTTEAVTPSAEGTKDLKDWTSPMTTFNPQMYTSSKSFNNLGNFVAQMATMDGSEKLEFVPYHAAELPSSSDGGITWTVRLRDDLVWDDGTPINADTYVYTMKMLVDPKLANKNAVYMFDSCVVKNAKEYFEGKCDWEDVGVKKIDDLTLEITLQYAANELDFWTTLGALIWPIKEDVYEACMNADRTSTTYGTSLETTPSCGRFLLNEWVIDGYDNMVRNENDPLVKMGYIKLDSMNRRYVSQNSTRAEMFFKGELDQHSLSGDEYLMYKDDPRSHRTYSANVWGVFVNAESKNTVMADQNLRLALQYAAPREQVAQDVYVLYTPASYIVSDAIFVGNPLEGGTLYRDTEGAKAIKEKYATNLDLALEYFDKAYEANGNQKITVDMIYFDSQDAMKRTAEVSQEVYENLFGKDRFELTIRAVVASAAYDIYREGNYDMGVGVRLTNVFNPWATMNVWTSDYLEKYITGFSNERFDELQYECVYGSLVNDDEGRAAALQEMEEMLMEFGAFIPLFQNDNTVIYSDRIWLATETYLPSIGYAWTQCDLEP